MNEPASELVIGVDIGGTNARAALIALGETPRVLSEARERIRENTSPENISGVVGRLVLSCCEAAQIEPNSLQAMGIGIAGQLDADHRTVINGPNLGWRDVPFAKLLESSLKMPVALFNDLSAITWGESRCGGGAGHQDLIVVYVGTGVGCGLVLNDQLYEGSAAKAGEIGHSKLHQQRRSCGCGEFGCLETIAGGRYLERRVAADLDAGIAEDLRVHLGLPHHPLQRGHAVIPSDLDAAAKAGVPYAERLWDEIALHFGLVMSTALALLNPSGWLLGGGVIDACPELRHRIVAQTMKFTVTAIREDLEVLSPKLGDLAGMIGAALLAATSTKDRE